jgi:Vi polysaccharide biosynthesis protein TviE
MRNIQSETVGGMSSGASGLQLDEIGQRCDELIAEATTVKAAYSCLDRARVLLDVYPSLHATNLTCALLLEKSRQHSGMLEHWIDMSKRFPDCTISHRYCLRWFRRSHREQDGMNYIETTVGLEISSPLDAIHLAQLYAEISSVEKADAILRSAIVEYPDAHNIRVVLGRSLKLRGDVGEAWSVIEPVHALDALPPSGVVLVEELLGAIAALDKLMPGRWRDAGNAKICALHAAIACFKGRRIEDLNRASIGRTALITGSLGAGGAERQMVNSAIYLEKLRSEGQRTSGVTLASSFEIVVSTLNPEDGRDFYLASALEGGVSVRQMQNMQPQALDTICAENPALSNLLPLLPQNVKFGVQRLVEYFRSTNVEVAYLWQDGAVLKCALAALIAGVPKIIVNLRGLPPNLRKHLFREEYEEMYKALALVPGVEFVSNGRVGAAEYSKWLGVPNERFNILPNGVLPLVAKGQPDDVETWSQFEGKTRDATRTIGGVFRFETDKRPSLWILFARAYLAKRPDSRFLLVGGGRMLEEAKRRAEGFGISGKILFVGESDDVGYWIKKMDVFLLLSRYEGLPNVLIEAQMAGIPVVSTPAGSACDTFVDGETGFLLSTAEQPSTGEMCEHVDAAIELVRNDCEVGPRASHRARQMFSVESMIDNTISLLTS